MSSTASLVDGFGVVQDQPLCDAGAAVVAGQGELGEAELAHEPCLVMGHRPLGVDQPGGIGSGLARVAVAAQVRQHDRVVPRQGGGNAAPHQMVLRIAVQQQQRRA
jgi:hypothetical protein